MIASKCKSLRRLFRVIEIDKAACPGRWNQFAFCIDEDRMRLIRVREGETERSPAVRAPVFATMAMPSIGSAPCRQEF